MNDLPDFSNAPDFSSIKRLVILYILAGLAIGFFEYTVAKAVLRNHPRRATWLNRKSFLICLSANAVAWPGILCWLALLGLMKGAIVYSQRKR